LSKGQKFVVAETGNIVAKNGNNVEATFDIVERIVKLVAFDNVAWTLLLVWTGLNTFTHDGYGSVNTNKNKRAKM